MLAFAVHANNIHKNIEIVLIHSASQIEILDTLVRLKDDSKPTDNSRESQATHLTLKRLLHIALVYGSRGYARTVMTTRPGGRN